MKKIFFIIALAMLPFFNAKAATIINHTAIQNFGTIPADWITQAKTNFDIAYGHTSHGSQLVTGMTMLAGENSLYSFNSTGSGGALDLRDYAMGGDVGYYPTWVNNTRSYLGTPNAQGRGSSNSDINIIMWSWCGQVSGYTEQNMLDYYLYPMTELEADYFGIKFVYMTGHLDGTGETGNLKIRNQQIRDYANAYDKILYDFADIESWDPSGIYYPNESDACSWCTTWCSAHTCPTCSDCAHSHCFNCYNKGKAFWYMMARLAGWSGSSDTTAPGNPSGLTVS